MEVELCWYGGDHIIDDVGHIWFNMLGDNVSADAIHLHHNRISIRLSGEPDGIWKGKSLDDTIMFSKPFDPHNWEQVHPKEGEP